MNPLPQHEPPDEPIVAWVHEHWAETGLVVSAFLLLMLGSVGRTLSTPLLLVWLHIPFYMLHQYEEHACPGWFMEFINRVYLEVGSDDYPLSEWDLTLINVHLTWLLMPGTMLLVPFFGFELAAWIPMVSVLNGLIHLSHVLYLRNYHPGVMTAVLLNVPLGAVTLHYLVANGLVSWLVLGFWAAVVVVGHLAILGVLLYRLSGGERSSHGSNVVRTRES